MGPGLKEGTELGGLEPGPGEVPEEEAAHPRHPGVHPASGAAGQGLGGHHQDQGEEYSIHSTMSEVD